MPLFRICQCGARIPQSQARCARCNRLRNARRRQGGISDPQWAKLSRRILKEWRIDHGDWCPGDDRHPSHPSVDLTVDHVHPLASGGPLLPGRDGLRVVCRSGNSARRGLLGHG